MTRIAIVGCGVIGATIAYELSQIPGLQVTVLDAQQPAQGCTGAALGILMGVISHKTKGKAWELRSTSLQRYETLIPELEAMTGCRIPVNRQGILKLCLTEAEMPDLENLVAIRQKQGWHLEILDRVHVQAAYPQIESDRLVAAIYSPQDRQIDPVALTTALVAAAERNGVTFQFQTKVLGYDRAQVSQPEQSNQLPLQQIGTLWTTAGSLDVDEVILTAGLGTTPLTQSLQEPIALQPVLGQALEIYLDQPLGNSLLQPVITGDDVHIAPLSQPGHYWVGATVEFPETEGVLLPDETQLETVHQKAIAFCPDLREGTIVKTWSGLRPRPENRPAPIIGLLPGYQNVVLATGHYRNGVLLAPATAIAVRQLLQSKI